MFDTERLKARIVEKYGNQKTFAEALDIEESTLSRYLSGREWKGSTMLKAIRLLGIPSGEIELYFFTPTDAKMHPEEVSK